MAEYAAVRNAKLTKFFQTKIISVEKFSILKNFCPPFQSFIYLVSVNYNLDLENFCK